MRTIEKEEAPLSWRRHAQKSGAYKDYKELDEARNALLREQGNLCCFCMQRINLRNMKIAHWDPQSSSKGRTMDWGNVMGACLGGDRERHAVKHCDTAQGNKPIKVNPADRTQRCERLIQYGADGHIGSMDPAIHADLDETLNLNNEYLKRRRRAILDALRTRLEKCVPGGGHWPPEVFEQELKKWEQRDKQGMFREYCQVAIYWLEKQLRRRKRAT
ncbi:MAG: TIGR02646 family protein [Polyangiaceae bacterium]|nr:TIGR02646 family protein [Polyangiaceae bacterium]